MTNPNRRELEFHEAMRQLYLRAKADANYNATYFLQMISDPALGGYGTARYLIHTTTPSIGYEALYERDRLDLTVGAEILLPKWHDLFTDEERSLCRDRLEAHRFDVDAHLARDAQT